MLNYIALGLYRVFGCLEIIRGATSGVEWHVERGVERRVVAVRFGVLQADMLDQGALRPVGLLASLDRADKLPLDFLGGPPDPLFLIFFRIVLLFSLGVSNKFQDNLLLLQSRQQLRSDYCVRLEQFADFRRVELGALTLVLLRAC